MTSGYLKKAWLPPEERLLRLSAYDTEVAVFYVLSFS